ncbi:MAG: N-acyl homoserine lactonase family protein [Chloroflexi bacterium]|nr:N-acyl homoserine lactonase family protein [Chloroflexota bacterium]
MGNCVIHPIPLFYFYNEKSLFTFRYDYGKLATLVCYVWYIEGPRERILIDAGGSTDIMTRLTGIPTKPIQSLDEGLAKLGLSTGDIDQIILTHLHHDHVGEARRFPRARLLVQKDELAMALNPHPIVSGGYRRELLEGLPYEVLDGDTPITDGVSVLKTPGHTPGAQSVSIKTAQGTAIIPGFCTFQINFAPPSSYPFAIMPPGIYVNLLQAYDSVLRVKQAGDFVISMHDPGHLKVKSFPEAGA